MVRSQNSSHTAAGVGLFGSELSYVVPKFQESLSIGGRFGNARVSNSLVVEKDGGNKSLSSESYKRRTTVFIERDKFLDIVCDALSEYKYVGPNQREDLILACRYVHNLFLFKSCFLNSISSMLLLDQCHLCDCEVVSLPDTKMFYLELQKFAVLTNS